MEIDEDEEEANRTDPESLAEKRRHPAPGLVVKRYWKSLVFWSCLVFVLVLVATLTPFFVLREENLDEDEQRISDELVDSAIELEKLVNLAFVPVASAGFWATGKPVFLEQMGSEVPVVEIQTGKEASFGNGSPFELAAHNALRLAALRLDDDVVQYVDAAPHGVLSAFFPLLNDSQVRKLGYNFLTNTYTRKEALLLIFTESFSITGPYSPQKGRIGFKAHLPIFYETENCSCSSGTPFSSTVNHVIARVGKLPKDLNSNVSLSEFFEYKKLDELEVDGSPLTPIGAVFSTDGDKKATMFCDPAPELGLMGLELKDLGFEEELQTADFLPECRYFWGVVSAYFDFDELTRSVFEKIEAAGLHYSLAKVEPKGENLILSQSPGFDRGSPHWKSREIELYGQTWSLEIVDENQSDDGWEWQVAFITLGAFLLALFAFLVVFLVVYRKQYLENVATDFSQFSSDAIVQLNRAAANEKMAIQNEAVAKKFLSTMSHELRTPLNSITAVSELMMLETCKWSGTEKEHLTRDCELIHDSAMFLKQIVDDILDFNKIDMGCLVITPTTFSPVRAVQAVHRLAKPLIKDPNLFFSLRVDPNTPNKAKADEHRFKQIIMNLASNAIKFIKAGGLTISLSAVSLAELDRPKRVPSMAIISGAPNPLQNSISASSSSNFPPAAAPVSQSAPISYANEWEERLRDCPKDRLKEITKAHDGLFVFVDVEDTGPGMTQEQKKAVFKPFFQNDPSKDAKAGGSGLGLSICSDLCKHMGGVIWATDPPGHHGTSFRFLVPLLEAEGKVSPEVIDALSSVALDLKIDRKVSSAGVTPHDKQGGEGAVVAEGGALVHHRSSDSERDLFRVVTLENWNFSTAAEEKDKNESEVDSPHVACEKGNLSDTPDDDGQYKVSSSRSSTVLPPVLKILLIDDSALNRLVFERLIKSLVSCSVDHAKTGEEGIQLAERNGQRYDLVVCDLNMGEGKTGLEVGSELKKHLNYPFVLALFTADVMVGLVENGPFQAVLYKPLSRELLVQFIVEHLDPKFFPSRFPPDQRTKKLILRKKKEDKGKEKE